MTDNCATRPTRLLTEYELFVYGPTGLNVATLASADATALIFYSTGEWWSDVSWMLAIDISLDRVSLANARELGEGIMSDELHIFLETKIRDNGTPCSIIKKEAFIEIFSTLMCEEAWPSNLIWRKFNDFNTLVTLT